MINICIYFIQVSIKFKNKNKLFIIKKNYYNCCTNLMWELSMRTGRKQRSQINFRRRNTK